MVLSPNQSSSVQAQRRYMIAFLAIATLLWLSLPSRIIPTPWAVFAALPGLFTREGFGQELWTSIALNLQAGALMVCISLLVGYATTIAAFRPVATAFAAGRFNSFVGLPLILTLLIGDQHIIKIVMLAIGGAVFSVQPIQDIVKSIPRERYDDARTLRMGEWRIVWEVVILGTFDQVIDVLRTCMAMGFVMLPLVEGTFRAEGGIGVFMLDQGKYMHLENVYCAAMVVSAVGLLLDRGVFVIKRWVCPYAFIGRSE